jgi:hypothetical protein
MEVCSETVDKLHVVRITINYNNTLKCAMKFQLMRSNLNRP